MALRKEYHILQLWDPCSVPINFSVLSKFGLGGHISDTQMKGLILGVISLLLMPVNHG